MYMSDLGWGYLLPGHNVHDRFRVGHNVHERFREISGGAICYIVPGHNVHERFRVGLSVTWA